MRTFFKWNEVWTQRAFTFGTILFALGTLDPLEGSPLLLIGGYLMARSQYLFGSKLWKWYRLGAILIATGFVMLHLLSYLGGFGNEALPWGWAVLLIPYPLGWLLFVILFLKWIFRSKKLS